MVSYLQGYEKLDNKAIYMDILRLTGLRFEDTYRLHSSNVTVQSTFSFSLPISIICFFYVEMFRVTRLKRPYLRDLSLFISLA